MAKNQAHRLPHKIATSNATAVIGLGRFGGAVAIGLEDSGVSVLGIDASPEVVAEYADRLTFAAQADTTHRLALEQLAIPDFDRVVLGIGAHLEASIVTASHLVDMGIANLWAKALTDDHARILRQLGVVNVIQPEAEMGARLARQITELD